MRKRNTYLVRAKVLTTIWREVDADSEEEAKEAFYDDSDEDIIEDARDSVIEDVTIDGVKFLSGDVDVEVNGIVYDDEGGGKLPENLPSEMKLTLSSVEPNDDIEELIGDEIEDKTGHPSKSFTYKIVKGGENL